MAKDVYPKCVVLPGSLIKKGGSRTFFFLLCGMNEMSGTEVIFNHKSKH